MVSIEISISTIKNMWGLHNAAEALPKRLRPHHDVTHWPPEVIHGLATVARQVSGGEELVLVHAAAERAVEERRGGGEGSKDEHFGIDDLEAVMSEVVGDGKEENGKEDSEEGDGGDKAENPVHPASGKKDFWYIARNGGAKMYRFST
jgi:hypothetical protein